MTSCQRRSPPGRSVHVPCVRGVASTRSGTANCCGRALLDLSAVGLPDQGVAIACLQPDRGGRGRREPGQVEAEGRRALTGVGRSGQQKGRQGGGEDQGTGRSWDPPVGRGKSTRRGDRAAADSRFHNTTALRPGSIATPERRHPRAGDSGLRDSGANHAIRDRAQAAGGIEMAELNGVPTRDGESRTTSATRRRSRAGSTRTGS